MLVTPAGIVTLAMLVQKENAKLPMLFTLDKITTEPTFPAGH
jgi:hypothetical protein